MQESKPNRKLYVCDRAGQYDSKGKQPYMDLTKQRSSTSPKKCGCKMRVQLKKEGAMAWKLTTTEAIHNHRPYAAPISHLAHRIASLDSAVYVAVTQYHYIGMNSAQILMALREEFLLILLLPNELVLVGKERSRGATEECSVRKRR
jgi:hypothetical protein